MDKNRDLSYAKPTDGWLRRFFITLIEDTTGRKMLLRKYREIQKVGFKSDEMWKTVLQKLNIDINFLGIPDSKIPSSGPVIFVANHPFGVLDGMILCHLAERTRESYKILLNSVLCDFPEVEQYVLPIDFDDTREAMQTNIESRKRAIEELERGGCVVIFPGGTVSTAPLPFADARDPSWKTFTATLIQKTQATVIPVFFSGENSRLFQIVSQYSMTLRLAMLLWELKLKMGNTVTAVIGEPLTWEFLKTIGKREELMKYLRKHVYELSPKPFDEVDPLVLRID